MGGTVSSADVEICAPASDVFALLVDLPAYPLWGMPFTIRMDSERAPLTVGTAIIEHVVMDPLRPNSIHMQRVVVTEVDHQNFRLCWDSIMLLPCILYAKRVQQLRELPDGRGCIYETRDTMSGVLSPLVLWLYGRAVSAGFAAQGQAIKSFMEQKAGDSH